MRSVKPITDEELLGSAEEALRVAQNVVDALRGDRLPEHFKLPLLHEGADAVQTAHAAMETLRGRAVGLQPPKVGD